MGNPIATNNPDFICFAFPDVCDTQVGSNIVPIPYPNVGNLGEADNVSTNVYVEGDAVILKNSQIPTTTGDEPGIPDKTKGKVEFSSASKSVFVNNQPVVRMFDSTTQNNGNAAGSVLSGVPTVLVGD